MKKIIISIISSLFIFQNSFAGFAIEIDTEAMLSPEMARSCYQQHLSSGGYFQFSSEYNNDIKGLNSFCQGNIQYPLLAELLIERANQRIKSLLIESDRTEESHEESLSKLRNLNQVLRNLPAQAQGVKFDIESISKMVEIKFRIEQSAIDKKTVTQIDSFPFSQFSNLDIEKQSAFLMSLIWNMNLKNCDQACINAKSLLKQIIAKNPQMNDLIFNQLKSKAGFSEADFNLHSTAKKQPQYQNSSQSIFSKQCKTARTIDTITYQFGDQFNSTTILNDECQQSLKIKTYSQKNNFSVLISIHNTNQIEVAKINHIFKNAKSAQDYYRHISSKE